MNSGNAFDLATLKAWYGTARITVSFTAIEINDGYQEVYICSGNTLDGRTQIYSETNLKAAGGDIGSQYWTFAPTTGSGNIGNYIYTLFGCNGWGDDDWVLNNVSLTIEFY